MPKIHFDEEADAKRRETPHRHSECFETVAQNTRTVPRSTDERRIIRASCSTSGRKRIEEVFGRMKTLAGGAAPATAAGIESS